MTERVPFELRERWTQRGRLSAHQAAARTVATLRRGLPFPIPETRISPLARRAPTTPRETLLAQLVVLVVGYATLRRLGVAERRARALAWVELEQARKLMKKMALTEAKAIALARRFIGGRKNWEAIERIAGELWFFNYEIATLKEWHNREIALLVDVSDGRKVPAGAFGRHGPLAGPSMAERSPPRFSDRVRCDGPAQDDPPKAGTDRDRNWRAPTRRMPRKNLVK